MRHKQFVVVTLFLADDVTLSLHLLVRLDGAWLTMTKPHLRSSVLIKPQTQSTQVIPCVSSLDTHVEHLNACHHSVHVLVMFQNLSLVSLLQNAML